MKDFLSNLKSHFGNMVDANMAESRRDADPLFKAVENGDIDAIKNIINDNKKLINSYNLAGETPFLFAIKSGSVETARLLVRLGADINLPFTGFGPYASPVHVAVMSGKPEMIGFVKSLGFSLSEKAKNQYTPLRHATVLNDPEMIKALLSEGANPEDGEKPLLLAALAENKDKAVKTLLAYPEMQKKMGRDFVSENNKGIHPVFASLEMGYFDTAREIFEMGVPVNCMDDKGNTPLHWALYHQDIEFAEYLVRNGADVSNIYNTQGLTPFHMLCTKAREYKQDDICRAFTLLSAYSDDLYQEPRNGKTLEKMIETSKSEPLKDLMKKRKFGGPVA